MPELWGGNQTGTDRIFCDVVNERCEYIRSAFRWTQDVVVRLFLEFVRAQQEINLTARSPNEKALIASGGDARNEQVEMIGHQAVHGNTGIIICRLFVELDAEFLMPRIIKPTGGASCNCHCPVDDAMTAIGLRR